MFIRVMPLHLRVLATKSVSCPQSRSLESQNSMGTGALVVFNTAHAGSNRNSYQAKNCFCGLLQVIMFFICAMFLAIRGATGCVAIYLPMQYEKYWAEDKYFYPLDTLPEFIVLVIMSWPAFLARMAQSWPKSLKVEDKYKDKSNHGSNKQANGQLADGQRSHNTATDGSHATNKAVKNTYVREQ